MIDRHARCIVRYDVSISPVGLNHSYRPVKLGNGKLGIAHTEVAAKWKEHVADELDDDANVEWFTDEREWDRKSEFATVQEIWVPTRSTDVDSRVKALTDAVFKHIGIPDSRVGSTFIIRHIDRDYQRARVYIWGLDGFFEQFINKDRLEELSR